MTANGFIFVGKILKIISTYRKSSIKTPGGFFNFGPSRGGLLERGSLFTKSSDKDIDFVVHFIDLPFCQPNFKSIEQLELLLLETSAALVSNDFADEIEYLKLYTMIMIVSSCYHEKGVLQQSNELGPRKFLPPNLQIALAWPSLPSPSTFWIAPRSLAPAEAYRFPRGTQHICILESQSGKVSGNPKISVPVFQEESSMYL